MAGEQVVAANKNPNWTEEDWKTLLVHIRRQKCTPFLGSGAAVPTLETGKAISRRWAEIEYKYRGTDNVERTTKYPFKDKDNLVRVSQYVAVHSKSNLVPKDRMIEEIAGKGPPAKAEDEPHHVMARLNLPLYLTTNYDSFMYQALIRDQPKRTPRQEHCHWYQSNAREYKAKLSPPASVDKPVVYHLHGVLSEVDSLVLTEDDYLNFVILTSANEDLIPLQVREAFRNTSLLFLGYSLEDVDFRTLFRRLTQFMFTGQGAKHVSVQLDPSPEGDTEAQIAETLAQRDYLERQLDGQDVKIFWGTCHEFVRELSSRL